MLTFTGSTQMTVYIPDLSVPFASYVTPYEGRDAGLIFVSNVGSGNISLTVHKGHASGQKIETVYAK